MTVQEHYENHLANFYAWMTGDFSANCIQFKQFLISNQIYPNSNKIAIDLGAAHGIQSVPLAEMGFEVIAVDFNQQLLNELKANAKGLNITTINDDIKKVQTFADKPELIVCCGDTLSHLNSKKEIQSFIANISNILCDNGKLILSFRNYSTELKGTDRFIPVKSDHNKILTCILDYEDDSIYVTDLLYEKKDDSWKQTISTYQKVRVLTDDIINYVEANNLTIVYHQFINRLTTIIAIK
jgi:2-polyprenyl-3-methyl-5-hydroxy-6-metoxy-1,4-benzoquinol methylase